jgi:outer membrane protein OmpA-like peptidoglycan-associated protein
MYHFMRSCRWAVLLLSLYAQAQQPACDSLEWRFGINQFAIDGNQLMADLSEKGWTPEFFNSSATEITIYGSTDCPGSASHNAMLAHSRALYLYNYFDVTGFAGVKAVQMIESPERNCSPRHQGYKQADRTSALKVCISERVHSVGQSVSALKTEGDGAGEIDQINLPLDSLFIVSAGPKKTLEISSKTPELSSGDEVILEGLNFYPGSHHTLPETKPVLKKLLELLRQNESLRIEVQGHVCCSAKPNQDGLDDETGDYRLSWNRAQFVRDYLIQNGIDEERVTYRGFAMTRPLVYPEVTIQDQIKNRRVEILILDK